MLRRALQSDIKGCLRVRSRSTEQYLHALNQVWNAGDRPALVRLCHHLLRSDANTFWVAEADAAEARPGQIVGFGAASARGSVRFLGMLFVTPESQGRGIGSGLLEKVLDMDHTNQVTATQDSSPMAFALATDTAQPIANGLYGAYGIIPREPIFDLLAPAAASSTIPELPPACTVDWFRYAIDPDPGLRFEALADLNALDHATLGFEHPQDHHFLWREKREGLVVRDGLDAVIGYGYVSEFGRVGPIAAADPALLLPIIGELERGQAALRRDVRRRLWVPTAAADVFKGLLRRGWRIDGFPKLLCWSRPFGRFDGYLPGSLTLL